MTEAEITPERDGTEQPATVTLIPGLHLTVHPPHTTEPTSVVLWIGRTAGDDSELSDALHELCQHAAVFSVRPQSSEITESHVNDVDRSLQWVRSEASLRGWPITALTVVGVDDFAALALALMERVRARGIVEIALVIVTPSDTETSVVTLPSVPGYPAAHFSSIDRISHTLTTALSTAPPATTTPPAIHVHEQVEPATRAFLDRLAHWDATSIHTIRESYRALPRTATPPHPEVHRSDAVIRGAGSHRVPVRWYRPTSLASSHPTLVYLHGGAYIMGTLDENDDRLDLLSLELGCAIVSIDYRLAPEHPYPAALQDIELVWRSITADTATLGDAGRIAVIGSSAGAGLAAALCIRLRKLGLPQPLLQCLVYPMLDDRTHPSVQALSGGSGHWGLWPHRAESLSWNAYLSEIPDPANPPSTAVPGRAAVGDLVGVAPAFIGVGDVDALVDSNLRYAASLIAARVPTELRVYPGVIHGGFVPRPVTVGTQAFLGDVVSALSRAFQR